MSCSRTTTQWRQWGSNLRALGLESSTLPLSLCTPIMLVQHTTMVCLSHRSALGLYINKITEPKMWLFSYLPILTLNQHLFWVAWDGSFEYSQYMFWLNNKIILITYLFIFNTSSLDRPSDLWWAGVIVPWFQNMAHHFPRQWAQWSFLVVKKSYFNK